ncbi:MAG: hypothetical protein HW418_4278 [Anaerolineales bacterium]|nr:hypothetical protein [Anaerolineales bacterium]
MENLLTDECSLAALWLVLTKIDADLARQACAEGCRCGGALHRADYPRKVRGVKAGTEAKRHSFCCAEEGCRRRVTPGSVRFLGRRVYAGFVVVLLTALRHGMSAARVQVLREQLGVERRTLERWREWWLEQFASGRPWRLARARFMPLLDEATLPWSLWTRFCAHGSTPLLALLRFLTPWSTRVAPAN